MTWDEFEVDTDRLKHAFILNELSSRSVILFCETRFITYLSEQKQHLLKVTGACSAAALRKLDEKEDGEYRLLVCDDPMILCRGLDFRGHQNGLTLIQAKPAPDRRCLTQLGYRVGRMGERCSRYRFKDVEAVEPDGELTYKKNLLVFLSYMKKKEMQQIQASKGLVGEKRMMAAFLAGPEGQEEFPESSQAKAARGPSALQEKKQRVE